MHYLQPLVDKVLIQPDQADAVSKGGIIIPDMAKERAVQRGLVLMIGEGVKEIAIGDYVIFGKFSGNEFEIDSKGAASGVKEKYLIIKEEDILAKEV